jgi:hypothetical protein
MIRSNSQRAAAPSLNLQIWKAIAAQRQSVLQSHGIYRVAIIWKFAADKVQTIYPLGVRGGRGLPVGFGPGALPSHVHDALLSGNNLQLCGAGDADWDENRSSIDPAQKICIALPPPC